MSVLASLTRAYERMADRGAVPPFGYSNEKIAFLVPLKEDGTLAGPPIDLREGEGRRRNPRMMAVPASFKRPGVTPRAFFLWDNTAFALGVTAAEGKDGIARFAAFRKRHQKDLDGTKDAGLLALLRFVETWTPAQFNSLGWPEEMKDQNVVFALESERLRNIHIHDRPAARALWATLAAASEGGEAICLVSGDRAPIARLHPAIKGVWGAQSAGASLVSFNLDAFTSYGHEQGDNAPVSEAAAFAYTTALNKFLERDSRNRIQIGDSSTVFWADAAEAKIAEAAETVFGILLGIDEEAQANKVRPILEKIRAGRPIAEAAPELVEGVRFYVLGLAPNAARLSVRFWLEDDFGAVARNFARHLEAMRIAPPPKDENPSIWRCLIEAAVQRKSENIPPNLAGEWLRAILTGASYPLTLLATVLMRLRADKDVNALRVAILKSVLITRGEEVPVALDPENRDQGYLLGRLFALYEYVQTAALGRNLNSTIKDKFYGAASATPRKVFTLLDRGSAAHLAKVGKERKGQAISLEKQIGAIMDHLAPSADPFPASLPSTQQALFAVGYYHQKNEFYRRKELGTSETETESHPEETPA
jgi:CRISPR-associated protein Csd1